MNDSSLKHTLGIFGLSFAILIGLSALPIGELTNNIAKDFNLFEDLFPKENDSDSRQVSEIEPDAELIALLNEHEQAAPAEETVAPVEEATDVVAEPYSDGPEIIDGIVCFENYSGQPLLSKFRQALSAAQKPVNIAVIGDSFIEGDIFCQDLRELLQSRLGGCGVGHLCMHTDFPGFRKSVSQADDGWTVRDVRSMGSKDSLRQLSGDYALAAATATATCKGTSYGNGTSAWDNSSFTYIAPASGTITLTNDNETAIFEVVADSEPATISLSGHTSKFRVESNVPGLKALGASLDGNSGVQLDCMSIRGNSGISHARLNKELIQNLRKNRDYSLIIIEFGTNALSAEQTDYSPYRLGMQKVVAKVKECYPAADIVIMGVPDRGVKEGTEVKSMPNCTAMVKAQRELARNSGVLFWDTREAMGGDGAVAEWRKRKLVNADYIHLNHAGGKELASLMFNAFTKALDE